MKFGRTYRMLIQTGDPGSPLIIPANNSLSLTPFQVNLGGRAPAVEIAYPLTLEFQITRNTFASSNTARFTLYNLGDQTRRQVFHDRYDMLTYRQIIVQAGYESDNNTPLATIFQGNVQSAYSYKRKENWTTVIDCFDGGFGIVNGQISMSVDPTKTVSQVITTLVQAMPYVTAGTIDIPDVQKTRGASFFGNAWDIIRRLVGNNTAHIDNEKVSCVQQGTYIITPGGIPLLNSDTGLLGTPRRLGALLEVDMIFEPRIGVNQLVSLDSEEQYYNGQYAVMGINHHGTISGALCGDAITTLSLWSGVQALEPAQQAVA